MNLLAPPETNHQPTSKKELIQELTKLQDCYNWNRTSGDRVAMMDIEENMCMVRRKLIDLSTRKPEEEQSTRKPEEEQTIVGCRVLRKPRECPHYRLDKVTMVREMLLEGKSYRAIRSTTGVSVATIGKIKQGLNVIVLCKCGKVAGHKGWCLERLKSSPARKEFLAGWGHTYKRIKIGWFDFGKQTDTSQQKEEAIDSEGRRLA